MDISFNAIATSSGGKFLTYGLSTRGKFVGLFSGPLVSFDDIIDLIYSFTVMVIHCG